MALHVSASFSLPRLCVQPVLQHPDVSRRDEAPRAVLRRAQIDTGCQRHCKPSGPVVGPDRFPARELCLQPFESLPKSAL